MQHWRKDRRCGGWLHGRLAGCGAWRWHSGALREDGGGGGLAGTRQAAVLACVRALWGFV